MRHDDTPSDRRQLLEQAFEENADRYLNSGVPCLGLPPEWEGFRSTGASEIGKGTEVDGRSDPPQTAHHVWTVLQLEHGSPDTHHEPYVRTESRVGIEPPPMEDVLAEVTDDAADEIPATVAWSVDIGSQVVELTGLRTAVTSIGRAEVDGVTLTVVCRSWPFGVGPARLVAIDDFRPYLEGWRNRVLSL
jgi:hypothetical protein